MTTGRPASVSQRRYWIESARWGLVLIYAWAAGAKLWFADQFHATLARSGLFPDEWLGPLAWGVPVAELVVALGLAARAGATLALFVSVLLSSAFGAVHAFLLATGDLVPCGCSGALLADRSGWWEHLLMLGLSLAMLLASCALLFSGSGGSVTACDTNDRPTTASH